MKINYAYVTIFLCLVFGYSSQAQTKKIFYKSHSGNLTFFTLNGEGDFGLPPNMERYELMKKKELEAEKEKAKAKKAKPKDEKKVAPIAPKTIPQPMDKDKGAACDPDDLIELTPEEKSKLNLKKQKRKKTKKEEKKTKEKFTKSNSKETTASSTEQTKLHISQNTPPAESSLSWLVLILFVPLTIYGCEQFRKR